MKIKHIIKLSVILILITALAGCQPKIYGARKHKKDRNCGCEIRYPSYQNGIITYIDNNDQNER